MAMKLQASYKGFKFFGEMQADKTTVFTSISDEDGKDAAKTLRFEGKSLVGRKFVTPARAGRAAFDAYQAYIQEDPLPAGRFLTLKQLDGSGYSGKAAPKKSSTATAETPAKRGRPAKAAKAEPEDKSLKTPAPNKTRKTINDDKAIKTRASRRAGPVTTRKAVEPKAAPKAEAKAKAVAKGKTAAKAAPKSRKPAAVAAVEEGIDFED